jgi:hypothetical protein
VILTLYVLFLSGLAVTAFAGGGIDSPQQYIQLPMSPEHVMVQPLTFLEEVLDYLNSTTFVGLIGAGVLGLIGWFFKSYITYFFQKKIETYKIYKQNKPVKRYYKK